MFTKYFAILDNFVYCILCKKKRIVSIEHFFPYCCFCFLLHHPKETVFLVFSLSAAPYSHPEYIVINVIHAKTKTSTKYRVALIINGDHLPPFWICYPPSLLSTQAPLTLLLGAHSPCQVWHLLFLTSVTIRSVLDAVSLFDPK